MDNSYSKSVETSKNVISLPNFCRFADLVKKEFDLLILNHIFTENPRSCATVNLPFRSGQNSNN